jgi:hypothetical protein
MSGAKAATRGIAALSETFTLKSIPMTSMSPSGDVLQRLQIPNFDV